MKEKGDMEEMEIERQLAPPVSGYLSADNAAKFLDTSLKTLERFRKEGALFGTKLGGVWKYKISDLERLLKKSS